MHRIEDAAEEPMLTLWSLVQDTLHFAPTARGHSTPRARSPADVVEAADGDHLGPDRLPGLDEQLPRLAGQ